MVDLVWTIPLEISWRACKAPEVMRMQEGETSMPCFFK